jgi:hypothetical protein
MIRRSGGAALVVTALMLQPLPKLPILQVVTLESLAANPQAYEGKEIVVAGVVIFGPESSFMAMPIPSPPGQQEAMWVQMPLQLARTGGPLEKEYLRLQRTASAAAILRGRFQGRERRVFGHLNCCRFQLEITKVLSVGGF